jgi:hypothetical protein
MKTCLAVFCFAALCFPASAQVYCTAQNKTLCESHLSWLADSDLSSKPINEIAIAVGRHLLGTPYVASTLEIAGEEQLVVDLSGLDCTTFLENVIVFSRLAKQGKYRFDDFTQELELLRYRNGERDAYPSRLHYFTDWIYDNQEKGLISDVSEEIGGKPYEKHINFMSTHRSAYKQLADESFYSAIQQAETDLNTHEYHYLPKAELRALESGIRDGDLIAITTSITGLDVVHKGFAIWKNGRVHLFHASSTNKKVEISEKPLAEYLAGNKSQSGVIVCRLVD